MKSHTGNDTSVCFQYWYSVFCLGTATYTASRSWNLSKIANSFGFSPRSARPLCFLHASLHYSAGRLKVSKFRKQNTKFSHTSKNNNNFLTFPACFSIPIIFSNLNLNCPNLSSLRNLQEQVKKAFCYQKLF